MILCSVELRRAGPLDGLESGGSQRPQVAFPGGLPLRERCNQATSTTVDFLAVDEFYFHLASNYQAATCHHPTSIVAFGTVQCTFSPWYRVRAAHGIILHRFQLRAATFLVAGVWLLMESCLAGRVDVRLTYLPIYLPTFIRVGEASTEHATMVSFMES